MTSGLSTGLFVVSLILLFVGERVFGDDVTVRAIVDVIGLLGLVGSYALRRESKDGPPIPASVKRWSKIIAGGIVVGLLLYVAQTPMVMDKLDGSPETESMLGAVLGVGWVLVIGVSALCQIFLDASLLFQGRAPAIEERRVQGAVQTAVVLGLVVGVFAMVNYVASVKEAEADLSLEKVGTPSDAAHAIVVSLNKPIFISTFFPQGNEVYDEVKPYLESLQRAAPDNVTLLNFDHAFAPKVADALNIRDNGYIVFSGMDPREGKAGDQTPGHPSVALPNEKLRLGTDRSRARTTLRKFDAEVQKRLLASSRGDKRIYFTSGHGERDYRGTRRDPNDRRGLLRILNSYLKSQSYQVRQISAADGLINEVPAGASAVVIAGPTEEFLEAEEDALINYYDRGGRLFVFLEPTKPAPTKLLEHLGFKYNGDFAANSRTHVPLRRAPPDKYLLVTKRVSSHPSVTGLARSGEAVAMPMTGTLEKAEDTKRKVQFTIKSMTGTFIDTNQNFQMDKDTGESTGQFNFAGVVEDKAENKDKKDGRAIVVGSAEVAADFWLKFKGNQTLIDNGFKWLVGEEELAVTIKEIPGEDVPIQHSKGTQTFWFYATIFLFPALVLGGGLTYVNRQRRRRF